MPSDFDLWLYFLIFLGFTLLIKLPRSRLDWSLPSGIQAIVIAMLAMSGLTFHHHHIFAACATGWFILFFLTPWRLIRSIDKHTMLLDAQGIRRNARWLPWLTWGKRGQFSADAAYAVAAFIEGDALTARAIINKWQSRSLPKEFQWLLTSYSLWGELLVRNYSYVVSEYERLTEAPGSEMVPSVAMLASRAYAELGSIDQATECFEVADIEETRSPMAVLARYFISFFCLSAASEEAQKVLSAAPRNTMPAAIKTYWAARLLARSGEKDQAKAVLAIAKDQAKQLSSSWRNAIERQINNIDKEIVISSENYKQDIAKIWEVYNKCVDVQNIIAPNHYSAAVMSMVAINVIIFLISNSYTIFPGEFTEWLRLHFFEYGMLLPPNVVQGREYWRLATYLFLHLNFAHLGFNMLALYWFGRIAENIFGTSRFFLIYFISGLISGIAHLVFSYDLPAIGASGAVMGIFGSVTVGMYALRERIPYRIWRSQVDGLIILGILQLVADQLIPHIAGAAHIGGFVAGAFLGYLLSREPIEQLATVRSA